MNYDRMRWFFLAACMVINICSGFGYAWSVFQKPLMTIFGWDAASVSLGFSIIILSSALPQALAGKAMDYIAPKQVILFGGIMIGLGIINLGFVQSLMHLYISGALLGLGMGITYPGTVANMLKFFPDKRGLAAGLLAAGMGSGAVIIAPLASVMIDNIGILLTLKILGSVLMVMICAFSRLIKTAPENYSPQGMSKTVVAKNASDSDKDWRDMLKMPLFYLLSCIFILGPAAGIMIMGHASPIAQQILGISPTEAAIIVGLIALANTGGRVFWGGISDKLGRYPVLAGIFVVLALSLTMLTKLASYYAVITAMMCVGMCYGGFMGLMASVTADSFGSRHLGVNFGIMFLNIGIASIVGPRMAAVVAQSNNGDYTQAFIIATGFSLVGLSLFIVKIFKK